MKIRIGIMSDKVARQTISTNQFFCRCDVKRV